MLSANRILSTSDSAAHGEAVLDAIIKRRREGQGNPNWTSIGRGYGASERSASRFIGAAFNVVFSDSHRNNVWYHSHQHD